MNMLGGSGLVPHDREDLAQDVCVRLLQRPTPPANTVGYAITIARRLLWRLAHPTAPRPRPLDFEVEDGRAVAAAQEARTREGYRMLLRRIAPLLTPRQRLIAAGALAGNTEVEVAHAVGASVRTVQREAQTIRDILPTVSGAGLSACRRARARQQQRRSDRRSPIQ